MLLIERETNISISISVRNIIQLKKIQYISLIAITKEYKNLFNLEKFNKT